MKKANAQALPLSEEARELSAAEKLPGADKLPLLTPLLTTWYAQHRRSFPWRDQPTPYRIWVSEIMLQQTRIEAALPYFERFMQTLPTVEALARAEETTLLKLWEGLGYYSRVRNMQKAARLMCTEFGAQLPTTYDELLRLPGIGEYTAGAIASIAYGQRVPAVDGNVLRVMARLLDDDRDVMNTTVRRELSAAAAAMVPAEKPGAFNEAIMELGETICLPNTQPRCESCPLADGCRAKVSGRAAQLPTRVVRTQRRMEERTVLVIVASRQVLLHKRPDKGLLAGLWELPSLEGLVCPEEAVAAAAIWGAVPTAVTSLRKAKHLFSHVEWRMEGLRIDTPLFAPPEGFAWANAEQLREDYALPSAFRTYSDPLPAWLAETDEEEEE